VLKDKVVKFEHSVQDISNESLVDTFATIASQLDTTDEDGDASMYATLRNEILRRMEE
jgi:hypothetical protein